MAATIGAANLGFHRGQQLSLGEVQGYRTKSASSASSIRARLRNRNVRMFGPLTVGIGMAGVARAGREVTVCLGGDLPSHRDPTVPWLEVPSPAFGAH